MIWRIIRIGLGVFFLLLAIVSMFLPILQAWLFFLVALALLSRDVPIIRRLFKRLKKRFPRQAAGLRKAESRLQLLWWKIKRFFLRESPNSRLGANRQNSTDTDDDAPK